MPHAGHQDDIDESWVVLDAREGLLFFFSFKVATKFLLRANTSARNGEARE